ncbi:unnamed protein product, partial [Scytosiphon promiscuus]
ILGTSLGLLAYFQIGFYVAALVSAAVSLLTIVAVSLIDKRQFDFNELSKVDSGDEVTNT